MGRTKFSRALKRSICIEYMQSGMSRKEILIVKRNLIRLAAHQPLQMIDDAILNEIPHL